MFSKKFIYTIQRRYIMQAIKLNSEQSKEINTSTLTIKGNIIECNNIIMQLSNVSTFEAVNAPALPFPTWSILLILGGLIMLLPTPLIALLLLGTGIFCIVLWNKRNNELKGQRYLYIVLNSGQIIKILFTSLDFLQKVLNCIQEILTNPDNKQEVHINIKGNTITGGSVINNLSTEK